jgi:FeS assembly SUF system protein
MSKKHEDSPPQNEPAESLEEQVIDVLRTVYDPEIPVSVYDLGLIYGMDAASENVVVRMTLTHPGCPMAASMQIEVQSRLGKIPGVKSVRVDFVWDPPWNPGMISDTGKLQLGLI